MPVSAQISNTKTSIYSEYIVHIVEEAFAPFSELNFEAASIPSFWHPDNNSRNKNEYENKRRDSYRIFTPCAATIH
jgi:hypothetical protein